MRLKYHDFASQWKHEEIFKYPEIRRAIEKLEKVIIEKYENGRLDPILFREMEIQSRKHMVNLNLFPRHNAMGYSFIEAWYLYNENDNNENDIEIVKMSYL